MNFNDFNFNGNLNKALSDLEFDVLTSIQEKSIPLILNKKNLLAISYTGSGKTVAFVLPVLENLLKEKQNKNSLDIIILVPTRELCLQINDFLLELLKYNDEILVKNAFGSRSSEIVDEKIKNDLPNVLISTPVKLKEYLEKDVINFDNLKTFILDEADLLLEQNTDLSLKYIFKKIPLQTQKLMFSASFNDEVENTAKFFLKYYDKIKIDDDLFDLNLIEQNAFFVDKQNKDKLLLDLLDKKEVKSGIIFTNTKDTADNLVRFLVENNIKVEALHSAKSNFHRIKVINNLKLRKNKFLVSTDLGSRGLDIDNLTHVINYQIPQNAQNYLHRIGRVGRAGNKGIIFNLVTLEDRKNFKKIEQLNKDKIKLVTHEYHSQVVFENKVVQKKSRKKIKSNFKGKKKK